MVWRCRQGLESTSPRLTSGPCVLLVCVCCAATSLPTSSSMAGSPRVELCSHSAAVEGSGNHSAGCTLFAQTPVIAPLSRVGLLWVMAECVMLESTTFSCRTQKVLFFFFNYFYRKWCCFSQSFIQSLLTTADNTQHLPNHCCPYSEQIFKGLGPYGHCDHDTGTLYTLYFALSTSSHCLCQRWNFYAFSFPRKQIMMQE